MAENVESRFDTSNCELDRPLPKGKKSNWINERLVRQKNGDKKAKTKKWKLQKSVSKKKT